MPNVAFYKEILSVLEKHSVEALTEEQRKYIAEGKRCKWCQTSSASVTLLVRYRDRILPICITCLQAAISTDGFTNCKECGEAIMDGYIANNDFYCYSCLSTLFVRCIYCGKYYKKDNTDKYCTLEDIGNFNLSSANINELLDRMEERLIDNSDAVMCTTCFNGAEWMIHDYSYNPRFTFYKTKYDYKQKQHLYYGIELEVKSPTAKLPILSKMPEFVYFKNDSSVEGGFEIVSHPTTYNWLIKNKDKWGYVLSLLKNNNCKVDRDCGIHIHMSLRAFSPFHLYKMMWFINNYFAFIYKISQRPTIGRLERWSGKQSKKVIIHSIKTKYREHNHVATNLSRKNTLEVRIFQSTLDLSLFYKNIQFCDALYSFSKDSSPKDITPTAFSNYVMTSKKHYGDLYSFIAGLLISDKISSSKVKKEVGHSNTTMTGERPRACEWSEIPYYNISWTNDNSTTNS